MDMPVTRRAELLDRIVEALLDTGAADLSLRPLAERVDTSARLLIYHFGSKDLLVAAAIERVHEIIAVALAERAAQQSPTSLRALLTLFWTWTTEPASQRYFRLLFEIDGLALYARIRFSEAFRQANDAFWVALIARASERLPPGDAPSAARATLIFCALSGLQQELLAKGDLAKTTAAFEALLDLIAPEPAAASPVPGSPP